MVILVVRSLRSRAVEALRQVQKKAAQKSWAALQAEDVIGWMYVAYEKSKRLVAMKFSDYAQCWQSA
jgi:hypothetical protein